MLIKHLLYYAYFLTNIIILINLTYTHPSLTLYVLFFLSCLLLQYIIKTLMCIHFFSSFPLLQMQLRSMCYN